MSASSVTGKGPGSTHRCFCGVLELYLKALTKNVNVRVAATLSGVQNGINRNFNLSLAANELFLFKNGILQTVDVDYELSDDLLTVIFMLANEPQANDVLVARVSQNLIKHLGLPELV